ncbi:MAG TPA: hypothetical protein VK061_08045 [Bacillota bacterium]|nr:hypothetical protein [Bacillota bacterium]
MYRLSFVLLFTLFFSFLLYYIFEDNKTNYTLKYFPFDENVQFENVEHSIQLINRDVPYTILWENYTITDIPLYLRQDVSLLYANNSLIGIRSIWKENEDEIEFKEQIPYQKEALFQAISYAYGEHHDNEEISSIYQMSDASLYVKQDSHHKLRVKAFQNNTFYANQILDIFRNSLYKEYEDLAEKLHIQVKNYEMFPLIYLHKHYIHNNLLLPKEHKRQIIAQLWEGLYQNYILPILSEESMPEASIPFILQAKDNSHLLVLYKINGKPYKLIQQYPNQNELNH